MLLIVFGTIFKLALNFWSFKNISVGIVKREVSFLLSTLEFEKLKTV